VGQIFEARHQPGTIAYSTQLQLEMLQETVSKCAQRLSEDHHRQRPWRNNFLLSILQTQLDSPKDYMVYAVMMGSGPAAELPAAARPSKPGVDGHAGEGETSNIMAHRPELAHPERASTQSGADQNRLELPDGVYTGIWWFAKFPNHYQGDAAGATAARGDAATRASAARIANAIRAIKRDETGPSLQKEFFDKAARPAATKQ
jgi:creatinine amidohydrolase